MKTKSDLSISIPAIKVFFFGYALFGFNVVSSLVSDSEQSRIITIPYRLSVVIIGIFLMLKPWFLSKKQQVIAHKFKNSLALTGLLIFVTAYSCRVIWDTVLTNNALTRDNSEYLFFWLGISLIPSFSFFSIDISKFKEYFFCCWILLLMGNLLSLFSGNSLQSAFLVQQGRFATTVINPILLGSFGSCLSLMSLFYIWQNKKSINPRFLGYLIGLVVGIVVLILAASKGPFIGFILSALILICFNQINKIKFKQLLVIFTISVSFIFLISYLQNVMGTNFYSRVVEKLLLEASFESLDTQRVNYFQASLTLIDQNLWLGYGLELPGEGYPHNLILESFLATGLIGGILFIYVYCYTLVKAIRLVNSKEMGWLGLLYIQYAILALLSGSLYASFIFWYLLFAVVNPNVKLFNNSRTVLY